MRTLSVDSFTEWRSAARVLLDQSVCPEDVLFLDGGQQSGLFDTALEDVIVDEPGERNDQQTTNRVRPVPKRFLKLAETVACHTAEERYQVLFRTVWRLTRENPRLLEASTDDDVYQLLMWEKAVRRDAHKMKAFVRFREIACEGESRFVAWHRPDYRIGRVTGAFFARRFPSMRWSILMPEESIHWDLRDLTFAAGAPRSEAPSDDAMEDLWRTYYRSTFNPARIKLKAMKAEMPVRHWSTLPETDVIEEILAEAPSRVEQMISQQEGLAISAADFLPDELSRSIADLRRAAADCRGCSLCEAATQTVFGEGPESAKVVLVGEQPGDQEDQLGRPFVGPAGEVLNHAMRLAKLERDQVYITNAVKHFKFEPRGKRRIHAKPNVRETNACKPWLEAELQALQPNVVVCLGATAAQMILGRQFRITKQRGVPLKSEWCEQTIATYHPAAILRVPDSEKRDAMQHALVEDLRLAAKLMSNTAADVA